MSLKARFSVRDWFGWDRGRSTNVSAAITDPLQKSLDIESLLQPFHEQSALTRSIVAVGCDGILGAPKSDPCGNATLFQLVAGENGSPAVIARDQRPIESESGGQLSCTLDSLARRAAEVAEAAPGNDLLLLPAQLLNELMTPIADDFSFRAVAVILPRTSDQLSDGNGWRLRRSLFDRGMVCIGSSQVAGCKALCFLASDAVRSLSSLDAESRGHITMRELELGARFANQMFRYSHVKLYAMRHGLTAAFPEWDGRQLFGLNDKSCAGLHFPRVTYQGFDPSDREMWDMDDPPIDLDLWGYFQELPECWRPHRPLLRRIFALRPEFSLAIEAWRDEVTDEGRRTLVAIHVRRGDYRNLQSATQFSVVPVEWYLDWLRAIWPTLRQPVLFVATDEPEAILPLFQEFEIVPAKLGPIAEGLTDEARDLETMRQADYLAICNSSFGRMAAILAPAAQKCFLPSFNTGSFEPYEPWIDPAFWTRFAEPVRGDERGKHRNDTASAAVTTNTSGALVAGGTIFVDVSDLLVYRHQATSAGMRRVECQLLINLPGINQQQPIVFTILNKRGQLYAIETRALLDFIEHRRSGPEFPLEAESELRALLDRAVPCTVRPRDMFLTIGAFWNVSGMGKFLQDLKNSGVRIGVFIHDVIPIEAPDALVPATNGLFRKGVFEALTFADFILTASEYNKVFLAGQMAHWKLDPLPVHLVPLGHKLSPAASNGSKVSSAVSGIVGTAYVLCAAPIDARNNQAYLLNIWNGLKESGRPDIPNLVLAGQRGWLMEDFAEQLEASDYSGGKVLVLHEPTDLELDLLYRNCILTVFPSLAEGTGLPVGESLAHGKICLCSERGGIPEAGGILADYFDPDDADDGYRQLVRYLDDPELRRSRERQIAGYFEPRSWRTSAISLLRSTQALASLDGQSKGVAAIMLPPGNYLPVGSEPPLIRGVGGVLSGELICISGWHPPEPSGVRAAQPAAMLRFRADAPAGTRINLVMLLAAYGREFRIRICCGSGTEKEVAIPGGSRQIVVLSCTVEPENLVTAHLLSLGVTAEGDEPPGANYWMLKKILYFDPKSVAARGPFQGPIEQVHRGLVSPSRRIAIRAASMDESRRAPSIDAFSQSADCFWSSCFAADRGAAICADDSDRRAFHSGCGKSDFAPQLGTVNDCVKLARRSDQFVSTSRSSQGSLFDRSGVWRAMGYLHGSPAGAAPWISNRAEAVVIGEQALAAAPCYEGSYLIFYNGNLRNYYHWLVEGLLCLDILSRALGHGSDLKIVLPKSIEIDAVFDHRDSLRAAGFGNREIVEVAADFIKVGEAIWVDSDQIQYMPAHHVKDFQRRVAALYANSRGPRNKRLLIARKGRTRAFENLEQVEAALSSYGFKTVYLEGMRIVDQILLFQSAEFIIGAHGAGLSNLLFCEPGTKVIELMPSVEFRSFFWFITQKLDLVYGLQFCNSGYEDSIVVDIGKLQALIRIVDAHSAN